MNERTLRTRMLLGQTSVNKLEQSHVAVFGIGGVGSWCAEALARTGVGALTLIDSDEVSESNINRQICALESTVGHGKAEVMAKRILDINPDVKVRPVLGKYESKSRDLFFDDYDYIVDCIDLVSCKVDLISSAIMRGIPIISALGTGNKANAEALTICDISETYGCPLARVVRKELRNIGIEHHMVVFSPEKAIEAEQIETPPPGRRSVPGSLVWVPATAGLLLCQHVVSKLVE